METVEQIVSVIERLIDVTLDRDIRNRLVARLAAFDQSLAEVRDANS